MRLVAHLRQNAIAYLALFVAMGGTAYAAASITGADVVNDSLTGKDVKEATLTGPTVLASGPTALNGTTTVVGNVPITLPRRAFINATGGLGTVGLGVTERQTIPGTSGNEATMALTGGQDHQGGRVLPRRGL